LPAASLPWITLKGVFNGLAGDLVGNRVWVANSTTKEIGEYVNGKLSRITTIEEASSINVIAYDASGGILYTGDPLTGDLFLIKLESKSYFKIANNLGEIRAIGVDKGRHRVLIADASRHKVWSVPDSAKPASPVVFYQFEKTVAPCGIAIQYQFVWITVSVVRLVRVARIESPLNPGTFRNARLAGTRQTCHFEALVSDVFACDRAATARKRALKRALTAQWTSADPYRSAGARSLLFR
jgi:hypothetical protein